MPFLLSLISENLMRSDAFLPVSTYFCLFLLLASVLQYMAVVASIFKMVASSEAKFSRHSSRTSLILFDHLKQKH